MKKRREGTFYVDDFVRIVTPEIFVRCGYAWGLDNEIQELEEKHGKDVDTFMSVVGVPYQKQSLRYVDARAEKLRRRIISEVAHAKLWQHKFNDDTERKLFTQRREEFQNCEGRVLRKKVVKTGFYSAAFGGNSYYDGDDYIPAGLSKERSHVILQVFVSVHEDIWIEAKNVELIKG